MKETEKSKKCSLRARTTIAVFVVMHQPKRMVGVQRRTLRQSSECGRRLVTDVIVGPELVYGNIQS